MALCNMIELSLDVVISTFLLIGFLFFFGLWHFYDRRDRRYFDSKRHYRSFHCVKCDALYGSYEEGETVECPKCLFRNGALKF